MACQLCELPKNMNDDDIVFVWPPQGHTLYKLTHFLSSAGVTFENLVGQNCVRICTVAADETLESLATGLSASELKDTRVLITKTDEPTLSDFGNVLPFEHALSKARGGFVLKLLSEGRFESFAQPIVSARDDFPIVGHEFLFRAHDTVGNMIMPDDLFEAAKDPQVLFNLDRFARISAVETAAQMPDKSDIFINFLPGSVYDPNVCLRTTVNKIIELDLDPRRIVFEVVESDHISDFSQLTSIINFYRAAGFRIALDDFGTGINNLQSLISLEPDFIKIDKSLVPTDAADTRRVGLVNSIVGNCHENDVRVIAEGIESDAQAKVMQSIGVDRLQGYHFGKPKSIKGAASAIDPSAPINVVPIAWSATG